MDSLDYFTDEDKTKFREPKFYEHFRHELESDLNVGGLPEGNACLLTVYRPCIKPRSRVRCSRSLGEKHSRLPWFSAWLRNHGSLRNVSNFLCAP
jgi:hypothetical protein